MKKGFTLIELLAVIVILAVIALIATPMTLNIIEKARKQSFRNSLNNVFRSAELYETSHLRKIDSEGIEIQDLELSNNHFTGKIIRDSSNNNELTLVTVGNSHYCASGTKGNLVVGSGSCTESDTTESFNVGLRNYTVTNNKISLEFKATDYESGIKSFLYCFNEANSTCENYTETTSHNIVINDLQENTNYKLYLKAKNGKDIINEMPVEFLFRTILFVAPVCSLNTDNWSIEKILTCNYTMDSGLDYLYSLDGNTWMDESNDSVGTWSTNNNIKTLTRTFNEDTTVYVRTTNGETNLNTTVVIDKIDRTNPVISNINVGENWTSSGRAITVTASDISSGIAGYYIGSKESVIASDFVNSSNSTYTVNKMGGTYNVFVIDAAGNISDKSTFEVIEPEMTTITFTLKSVSNDTVTITGPLHENNDAITATVGSSGTVSVTMNILAEGANYLFTSSVAKDPENSANNYSKQINLTSLTTEVNLMPDSVTPEEWTTINYPWETVEFQTVGGTQTIENVYVGTITCGVGEASETLRWYTGAIVWYGAFARSGAKYTDMDGAEHIVQTATGTSGGASSMEVSFGSQSQPYSTTQVTVNAVVKSITLTNTAYTYSNPSGWEYPESNIPVARASATATIKRVQ